MAIIQNSSGISTRIRHVSLNECTSDIYTGNSFRHNNDLQFRSYYAFDDED